jgi:hypothetical protein
MRLQVTIAPEGANVEVAAIDLAGDSWADFSHHLDTASQAEARGQMHHKNRSLRAAVISLAAHVEGVVNNVCARLTSPGNALPKLNLSKQQQTFRGKIDALATHAREEMATMLPPIPMRFKLVRDIIAHPGITKTDRETEPQKHETLTEIEVYDLSVDEVRRQGVAISTWLDRLCETYDMERVENTEGSVRELAEALGGSREPPRRV